MDNAPFAAGAKLAAYLRDSGGTDQELSVLQQEASIRAWCKERGYILTKVFKDLARPGSTTAGREAFEEMIQYFRSGGNGEAGVIVWNYSRFARSIDDAQFFKADLRRRGFEITSLQDNVPSGSEGRLIEGVIDYMNQRYLVDLSSSIVRGQSFVASVHHSYPLGRIPVGYKRLPIEVGKRRDGRPHVANRLVPDPETAPLVHKAYKLRTQGATYKEIHQAVHLFKHKPGYSKLLHNPIYVGRFVYRDLVIDNFCEPIVGLVLWNAVQNINHAWHERQGFYNPRRTNSRFILSGLLLCGHCSHPMVAKVARNVKNTQYLYYRCTQSGELHRCPARSIPKDQLEKMVIKTLTEYILRPDLLADLYREIQKRQAARAGQIGQELAGLRSQLTATAAGIQRIIAAITESGHSQALLKQLATMENNQQELETKIVTLECARPTSLPKIEMPEVIEVIIHKLQSPDDLIKERLLRSFVKELRARREGPRRGAAIRGEIVFYPPIPNSQEMEICLPLV